MNPDTVTDSHAEPARRVVLLRTAAVLAVLAGGSASASATPQQVQRRWYAAALAMKTLAESWGDQPYGAVLVLDGSVVGDGPSRVVKDGNPDAHAERVAILDAQRRLGRASLAGAVLVSTSRPCGLCEAAAARAGVARMVFGADLTDAGAPAPIGGAGTRQPRASP
jgi:tRNA(Arg) A34 adenosine deaminase TadA